jgi:hypothetical protein
LKIAKINRSLSRTASQNNISVLDITDFENREIISLYWILQLFRIAKIIRSLSRKNEEK